MLEWFDCILSVAKIVTQVLHEQRSLYINPAWDRTEDKCQCYQSSSENTICGYRIVADVNEKVKLRMLQNSFTHKLIGIHLNTFPKESLVCNGCCIFDVLLVIKWSTTLKIPSANKQVLAISVANMYFYYIAYVSEIIWSIYLKSVLPR